MALRRIVYFIMLYAILTYNVLYQTHDGMVMLIFFAAASISSAAMMLICGFNLNADMSIIRYMFVERMSLR